MADDIGKLVAQVVADTSQFRTEMRNLSSLVATNAAQINASLTKVSKTSGSFSNALGFTTRALGALGVALSVRALLGFATGTIKAADELLSLSNRLGVSVEALSTMQYVAKQSNVELGQLTMSMQNMARSIEGATKGTSQAGNALRLLGLNAQELRKQPLDEQFDKVIGKLKGVENSTQRLTLATQIFGARSGAVVLQMAKDYERLSDEAKKLGITMSTELAVRANMANEAMVRISEMGKAMFRDAVLAVAPLLTALFEVKEGAGDLLPTFDRVVDGITFGVGIILDIFYGWKLIFTSIAQAAYQLSFATAKALEGIAAASEWVSGKLADMALKLLKISDFVDIFGVFDVPRDKVKGFFEGIAADKSTSAYFSGIANEAKQMADKFGEALAKLSLAGRPSEDLKNRVAEARKNATELADELVRAAAAARAIKLPSNKLTPEELQEIYSQPAGEFFRRPSGNPMEQGPFSDVEPGLDEMANMRDQGGVANTWADQRMATLNKLRIAEQKFLQESNDLRITSEGKLNEQLNEVVIQRMQERLDAEKTLTLAITEQERIRAQAAVDTADANLAVAQQAAQAELGIRQQFIGSAVSLLQTLGAEHRGAAIAALAIEKAMAIQRILVQGNMAAAQILALGQIAAWQAMAQLGIFGGPAAAAAITAKATADAARVKAMSMAAAVFTGIEGAVQASQLSHGGTSSTLGTNANPVATRATNTGSGVMAHKRDVVEIHLHGDMYGWDDYVERKVIAGLQRAVNDREVVIINADSRQGQLLAPE